MNATSSVSVPYSSGGTVYYVPPCTNPVQVSAPGNPSVVVEQPTSVPSAVQSSNFTGSAPVTISDLAQLLTISRKDPLPKWKLESYDGNPLQWHEWFGQFRSAVDSAPLSADVKLTYLKTLVTGKAKTAIANFAYCGSMYQEALRTLERKFGQPQAVIGAYLEKLSNYPAVKMHSSDSIVSYASVITSLVSVFQSLSYEADLKSASLLNLAVSKLPPNMKEGWSLHTVKRNLLRPTLLDFNTWLQKKPKLMRGCERFRRKLLRRSSPLWVPRKQPQRFSHRLQSNEKPLKSVPLKNPGSQSFVLFARLIIRRGDALFSRKKRQHKEQSWWRKTNYAFPVFKQTTASVTVHSRENVRRTVATAATTPCCTALNAYVPAKCGVRSQLLLTLVSM